MSDGRKQEIVYPNSHTNTCDDNDDDMLIFRPVNQARALRVAEIINDYRTLLLHIPQQNVEATPEDYWEEGYVVVRECLAAAQELLASNYTPATVSGQANSDEAEKVQLQQ